MRQLPRLHLVPLRKDFRKAQVLIWLRVLHRIPVVMIALVFITTGPSFRHDRFFGQLFEVCQMVRVMDATIIILWGKEEGSQEP